MKVLVSDFDKTLFVKNKDIVKENIKAINRFISNGNSFIIETGRIYTDIILLLNEYNIKYNYLVCEDGAKIFNNLGYSIIDHLIPKKVVKEVIEVLNKYNLEYKLDDGYNDTDNINDCIKIKSELIDNIDYDKVLDELKDIDVYAYLSIHYLNITSSKINKEKALEYLIKVENYNPNNIYVIGDEINDYEMLQKYHCGVIKNHNKVLDELKLKEYNNLKEYIDDIEKK